MRTIDGLVLDIRIFLNIGVRESNGAIFSINDQAGNDAADIVCHMLCKLERQMDAQAAGLRQYWTIEEPGRSGLDEKAAATGFTGCIGLRAVGNGNEIFSGSEINVEAAVQGNMISVVVKPRKQGERALSNAEYRVARLAAEGLQYKEIARQLGVSPATIRNQLHSVYAKLGVSNKSALAKAILFAK